LDLQLHRAERRPSLPGRNERRRAIEGLKRQRSRVDHQAAFTPAGPGSTQETRSVDDQAEWLDNDRVLYAMPADHANLPDVWSVPADGTGAPRLFLAQAESPAVVTRQAFPRQRGQ
jgi:hypothetical protein